MHYHTAHLCSLDDSFAPSSMCLSLPLLVGVLHLSVVKFLLSGFFDFSLLSLLSPYCQGNLNKVEELHADSLFIIKDMSHFISMFNCGDNLHKFIT